MNKHHRDKTGKINWPRPGLQCVACHDWEAKASRKWESSSPQFPKVGQYKPDSTFSCRRCFNTKREPIPWEDLK